MNKLIFLFIFIFGNSCAMDLDFVRPVLPLVKIPYAAATAIVLAPGMAYLSQQCFVGAYKYKHEVGLGGAALVGLTGVAFAGMSAGSLYLSYALCASAHNDWLGD